MRHNVVHCLGIGIRPLFPRSTPRWGDPMSMIEFYHSARSLSSPPRRHRGAGIPGAGPVSAPALHPPVLRLRPSGQFDPPPLMFPPSPARPHSAGTSGVANPTALTSLDQIR